MKARRLLATCLGRNSQETVLPWHARRKIDMIVIRPGDESLDSNVKAPNALKHADAMIRLHIQDLGIRTLD